MSDERGFTGWTKDVTPPDARQRPPGMPSRAPLSPDAMIERGARALCPNIAPAPVLMSACMICRNVHWNRWMSPMQGRFVMPGVHAEHLPLIGGAVAWPAEGGRVGAVTCAICGAALVVDPGCKVDVIELHRLWHEEKPDER